MCGIAGMVATGPRGRADAEVIRAMLRALRHRGPDGEGVWGDGPVVLGSRRLAVLDLSPRASQPIANEDGSVRVVFNGEIYNFRELHEDLAGRGHRLRSTGDTETLVHLYEDEGVGALHRLRGMFAFALWDGRRQALLLARDRLGKKPLYYHHAGDTLRFASEAKALLQDPAVRAEPDLDSLDHFLSYGYVPSPRSAFRGIHKLPPAHYLLVQDGALSVERYWTLRQSPVRTESEAVLADELMALLEEAVRLRLASDVPVGALLSGGLDSSVVVALMRRLTSGCVRTFSIGFDRPEYDELPYARQVARHFETEHHELVLKPDATSVLPRLVWQYDEPFADSSALPAMWLSGLAREFVTVAVNGDGGDEVFGGYDRYRAALLASWCDRVPRAVRGAVRRAAAWRAPGPPKSVREQLRRFAEGLVADAPTRYASWISVFTEEGKRELYTPDFAHAVLGTDPLGLLRALWARSERAGADAVMFADLHLYLPEDLLVKMDIASMAESLEVRSPLLDQRVVEFAARLPRSLKLDGLRSKRLLRRAMRGLLPETILRRRKMGFAVPLDHWFRHELYEVAQAVLLSDRARARGYFRPEVVHRYLDEHHAGRAHRHAQLWALLVFELWHRTFVDAEAPPTGPLVL